ncbi:hypothetical protein WA538_006073 [Blastocystis sp. DL]
MDTPVELTEEEKQILEEKAKVEGREGVEAPEASPIDIQAGVYPRSYFDLEKYPTHWKLSDDPVNGKDCWIGLTGENFKIRGPNYLKDRKKIMSEECVFKCLCCELVNSKVKMGNFSARPVSLVQKLRAQGYKGFIYVYNIMVKHKKSYVSMLSYFEVPENLEQISPHVATLWKRYLEGDDTYRNDRLKMIARCPTGPWVIRKLIGNVPTIIGHKLPQFTYRGDGYCEQMIDATADKLIASSVEMGLKQAKKIVVDLALVIECKEEELLPERLLCAWRAQRPDLTQTVNID